MNAAPRIVPIGQAAQHIPALAQAHLHAFGALLPRWNMQLAEAELRRHAGNARLPITWIALDAHTWLGSVSLLHNEGERRRAYSPWLASLYVRPPARRHGVGAALVRHCVRAAAQAAVTRLHLYCLPPLVAFYRRLGWQVLGELPLAGLQLTVMAIDTQEDRMDA